ncbi:MAG: hypothetical protein LBV34_04255, partial [Nocardiopsaceae bacterium]|nr:hypothetical protein [Nocardiopsaceae bacterium]
MSGRHRFATSVAVLTVGLSAATAGCTGSTTPSTAPNTTEVVVGGPTGHYTVPASIHKIKHIIVIQQENRSFDSYFGTFPGAAGIPMTNGKPTVCVTDP